MKQLKPEELAIIENYSFAQIITNKLTEDNFPAISNCPLQLQKNTQLLGHLSANNPVIKSNSEMVKVIFNGPHGYISPRWHKEQVVPTWNYANVSLICKLTIIDQPEAKLAAMKSLSAYYDPAWDFTEFELGLNKKRVEQMLAAITVFTLDIETVTSKFKLSQNRSDACRKAFRKQLKLSNYHELANIRLS